MEKSYKLRQPAGTQESCAAAQPSVVFGPARSRTDLVANGSHSQVNDRSLPSRLKAKLGAQAGAAAVDYLSDVVTGAVETSPKQRIEAARTVLDRVGVIAPRAEAPIVGGAEDLAAMTAAELRQFVAGGLEELARRAKPAEIPGTSPAQPIDIFD